MYILFSYSLIVVVYFLSALDLKTIIMVSFSSMFSKMQRLNAAVESICLVNVGKTFLTGKNFSYFNARSALVTLK